MQSELALLPVEDYERLARAEIPCGNPNASEAMSLAHELRETEGMSMSEALSEAWARIRDGDDANPADESGIVGLVAVAGLGVLIHRLAAGRWVWEEIRLREAAKMAVAEAERIARAQAGQRNPGFGDTRVIQMSGYETIVKLPGIDGENIGTIVP